MEIINTEIVVSSLFSIGFDKVDVLLYSFILGQLSSDNHHLRLFQFEDRELSSNFRKYVDYDGITFTIKEGLSLESNISTDHNRMVPLRTVLKTNRKLVEYLSQLDLKQIVMKKKESLEGDLENLEWLFSKKEKELISDSSEKDRTIKKETNNKIIFLTKE